MRRCSRRARDSILHTYHRRGRFEPMSARNRGPCLHFPIFHENVDFGDTTPFPHGGGVWGFELEARGSASFLAAMIRLMMPRSMPYMGTMEPMYRCSTKR